MAHETTTTLAALYLKDVEREIYKQYFTEDELAKRLKVKGPKQVGRMVSGGTTVEIPAGIRPPTAARGAVEAEKIPTALTAVSDRFVITPKKQIVTGRITYEGIKLTRGKNAIKQGVNTMLGSLMDNFWHMMGTHLWGGPTNGMVGQIAAPQIVRVAGEQRIVEVEYCQCHDVPDPFAAEKAQYTENLL